MDKTEKMHLRKQVAMAERGGICECCGYRFITLSQAEFHHIDSSTKWHNMADMWDYSEANIQAELLKCVMLCNNCHSALHDIYGKKVNATMTYDFLEKYGNR